MSCLVVIFVADSILYSTNNSDSSPIGKSSSTDYLYSISSVIDNSLGQILDHIYHTAENFGGKLNLVVQWSAKILTHVYYIISS